MGGDRAYDSMAPVTHPVLWERGLDPATVESRRVHVVVGGARLSGAIADAFIVCDAHEHARRQRAELGAVTSMQLIDAVMNLPTGMPVRLSDLSDITRGHLDSAPPGVVEADGEWVTRLLSPPVTVVAIAVRGRGWARSLQRAARFTPFAQRLVVLDQAPPPQLLWEAQVAGIGVWAIEGDQYGEVCAPEPFIRRYWKPVGWRFAERAYACSLSAMRPHGSSPASADRPVRIGASGSGLRQLSLPVT
jgi:hypothetical protein